MKFKWKINILEKELVDILLLHIRDLKKYHIVNKFKLFLLGIINLFY